MGFNSADKGLMRFYKMVNVQNRTLSSGIWCHSGKGKGKDKVDVHESVLRDTIMKVTNKMQLYRLIYYSKSAVHVSGDVFAHHHEHLTVFTVSGSVHPSCCRLVSWMSWNWIWVQFQFIQDTWVNTTRYCKYSQVFLIMGENIARNM